MTDRTTVTTAFTLILDADDDLYRKHSLLVTDAKLDLNLAHGTIRIEGPGFERGTAVRIYLTSHACSEVKLVVDWDNRPTTTCFREVPKGKNRVEVLLGLTGAVNVK